MRIRTALLAGPLLFCLRAVAQLTDPDPDWKETEVPPPPAFQADRIILLEMPRHVSVQVGVDPDTLRITADGIVRYVIVAKSPSGNINASYEGIRCLTGEVKVYARYGASGKWNPAATTDWKPLNGNQPSLHALALARQGACEGRAASSSSANSIIQKLKSTPRDNVRN